MSDLQVRAVVADRPLDVEFSVSAGEVLAVLGPNGAGKSTALHVVAGLIRPDMGRVRLGERVLTDTTAGVNVAMHDRRVGLLLQNPLLFPHLSVAANVAFGLTSRRKALGMFRLGRTQEKASVLRWLREVDAEQLVDRKPKQLSGGEAQLVALARALAAEPDVLLLDEPLAGLDVSAASAIRGALRTLLGRNSCAVVFVTHDLLDVLTLADRVLVLEAGKITEIGPAAQILSAPRSHFGARFAGVNLVKGTLGAGGGLHTRSGDWWQGSFADVKPSSGHEAVAGFAPTAVSVYRARPYGSPHNVVEVTVTALETRGSTITVRGQAQPDGASVLTAEITVDAAAELLLTPGTRVWFSVKACEVTLYPAL